MATISGTKSSETINAADGVTQGGDTIFGLDGNDTIFGLGGNDMIKGGGGADTINGGSESDTAGYGDSKAGVVISLADHTASGGDADGDTLISIENLIGSNHADQLWGDEGVNGLTGLNGNDILKGFGGQDTLSGGDGDDDLFGGAGIDTMTGGAGNDEYWVDDAGDVIIEIVGKGADSAYASTSYALAAGVNVETLGTNDGNGTAAIDLAGNEIANSLYGNNGHNELYGGGNQDYMAGYGGNDWYFVDTYLDVVVEAAGQGIKDRVFASDDFRLAQGSEIEVLSTTDHGGLASIELYGNALDNEVFGNAGSNMLGGGGGNDVLVGMGGSDRFYFGAVDDPDDHAWILDFDAADDMFWLPESCVFIGQPPGILEEYRFHVGAAAADATDNVIYNNNTGELYYDADGSGIGAAVHFATVDAGIALTNENFYMHW